MQLHFIDLFLSPDTKTVVNLQPVCTYKEMNKAMMIDAEFNLRGIKTF